MEFRKINQDEQEQVIFVASQAFYSNCESEIKLLEKGKFRYEDFVASFNDDDKMTAIAQNEPQFMWLDGVSVKSGGVAYVASLPEYRRSGNIKKLMKLLCDDMYKNDYTMSFLYPFSHSYYRKFGYEYCCKLNKITANPKDLLRFKLDGYAKQFEPGQDGTDPEDIITIYNKFACKYNIMCDRDAWQWETRLEHDPVKTTTRTYIIYDNNDKAKSYFTYVYNSKGSFAMLDICDIAWIDNEGMFSLMAFIGKLFGNVKKIRFHAPPEMIPEYFWSEPQKLIIMSKPNGMARIINAQKALEVLKKPTAQDTFTIQIHDDFMKQNNKSYSVSWKDGKTEVKEFDGKCDIECSIMALAQILTGFIGLDIAISRKDLIVDDNLELLCNVFHQKMIYMADFF